MPSSPSPFVVEPAGWRARVERLLDGVARQRLAVAFVAVLALAAAGTLWLNAQPRAADPPPSQASGTGGAGLVLPRAEGGAVPGVGQPAGAAQPSGATIAVDLVGRVQRPGLVRLPQGSRVLDAIEAAGGTTSGAELEAVNLARKLVDGEQIRIPRHGEAIASPCAGAPGSGTAPGEPGGTGAAGGAGQPGVPLDLNTATAEQLDTLPGIGEVTVNQIIAYRTAHPFRSVDDLRQVPGIGDHGLSICTYA
ncbi:MAG TPA: ComEA family DNA-binding protein [Streptosporangiaceae bacterium]